MADELHSDAVEGGNYDVIRARMTTQGQALGDAAQALNARRAEAFGSLGLEVLGEERVRTEARCTPVDIVQVGGHVLFGYQVQFGLKQQMSVGDVLSLHRFARQDAGWDVDAVTGDPRAFLDAPEVQRAFQELFQYYKAARLIQLRVTGGKLLAIFQTGATALDVRVLRWAVSPTGEVTYIDDRGERDHVFPPTHDFAWTTVTREDHVRGRHPHVNILDTVFVETVGGDLTVKVEDNTETGSGVYDEPVDDPAQSLDDAVIRYAKLGTLILLAVQPFREERTRYLVFDTTTQGVTRIDAIGSSCVQLPEDQGILFPGGLYLATGENRVFDRDVEGFQFERTIAAPNGEDVLYVFHLRGEGQYVLYPYNVISKEITTPIRCHGWSLFDDGTLVVFRATAEPVRVHPMQVWSTPFVSEEVAEAAPKDGSLLARIGNKDLVRGVSDALTLQRLVGQAEPTRGTYEALIAACTRFLDAYYWAGEAEVGDLRSLVVELRRTAELIVDEFEKVQVLKRRAVEVVKDAEAAHDKLLTEHRVEHLKRLEDFMRALTALRTHRGHLIGLQDVRYVDGAALEALEEATVAQFDRTSRATVRFLLEGDAYGPTTEALDALLTEGTAVERTVDLKPLRERLAEAADGIRLLSEVVAGLEVDDPTEKAAILDKLSEVFAHANRVRATLEQRHEALSLQEGKGEFVAQFRLFEQTVSGALAEADTPEACDAQLSRLLLQLEELEGRFGEHDAFLADLADQRDRVYEALTARKQQLVEARQRRVEAVLSAAGRILEGVGRRARAITDEDELNAWFAGDPMVLKVRQLADQLAELGDAVRAEELKSKLKSSKQDALRGLRDKSELFDDAGLVKFGKHRFSVNTEPLALTLVFREGEPWLHLTGTDYAEPVDDPDFATTRPFWDQAIVSETADVARAEYLAASVLFDAEDGVGGLDLETLDRAALAEGELLGLVRGVAGERYDEGYDRGVHDVDAAAILGKVLAVRRAAGVLAHPRPARVLALLFWAFGAPDDAEGWIAEARALGRLRDAMGAGPAATRFAAILADHIAGWHRNAGFLDADTIDANAADAGRYLLDELARPELRFTLTQGAQRLRDALDRHLEDHGGVMSFEDALRPLADRPARRFAVKRAWLERFAASHDDPGLRALTDAADEAAVLLIAAKHLDLDVSAAPLDIAVEGLLSRHGRIDGGTLAFRYDTWLPRLRAFRSERVPAYRAYRAKRAALLEAARVRLRLDELQPRVMTSFVRNQLIQDVYLPMIGDNLAKQIGAAGEGKRTDLMGLLLLVSPPGYGKTTLMEYVANRLGLVFVKVNGPALGHEVTSLDPAEAPNATARQEVDKINLALEMGSNVMLYLDDIQHTHPELLQKFISLCDAQRRIEGVWKGRTRTYDLRGRTFCVVMAGNPYTESGAAFQIPDMLANRADTYNLGDVLSGRDQQFAMSFLENSVTSNPVLAPLAGRPQNDLYLLARMARGEEVSTSELSHDMAAVELDETQAVLKHLFRCRDVLLKVNATYVASAAMEDAFRTEPRFQLQGSYRNMNKLAEKVVPAMTDTEITALIDDHYQGEAQTLTTGAEANLLKLAELRGRMSEAQASRWAEVKKEFQRRQMVGGGDDDPATRITGVLSGAVQQLERIGGGLEKQEGIEAGLAGLRSDLGALAKAVTAAPTAKGFGAVSKALEGVAAAVGEAAAKPTPGGLSRKDLTAAADRLASKLAEARTSFEDEDDVTQPVVVPPRAPAGPAFPSAATGADVELAELLVEIRALRAALAGHVTTTPEGLASEKAAMLDAAKAALEGRAASAGDGAPMLVAAVEVIEALTRDLVASAGRRLSADDRDALVEDVRRAVAGSLGALAREQRPSAG